MISENNIVSVSGTIVSEFKFDHTVNREDFYMATVEISRLSGHVDLLPVLVSERLIDVKQNYSGKLVKVIGNFRSFSQYEDCKNHLVLSIFVKQLEFIEAITEPSKNNLIYLDGVMCREGIYRKTPLGREIADLLLVVKRAYGKSDCIPCIVWGRDAKFASKLPVGSRIKAKGRIQSREYKKRLSSSEIVSRTAYEVSIWQMEVIENADQD